MATMKAAVIHQAGGPEVIKVESRPVPTPRGGRSVGPRQGVRPQPLQFVHPRRPFARRPLPAAVHGHRGGRPRRSGPRRRVPRGDTVATAMGGMGRQFDGSYAEYTCVAASNVQAIKAEMPWETLGAMPEMLQTAWGSLFVSLRLSGRASGC